MGGLTFAQFRSWPEAILAGFGVEDWLDAYRSPATLEAYERDACRWLAWCAAHGVDPRTARRPDADAWRIHLEQTGAAAIAR